MKRYFAKLLILLFAVTETIFPTYSAESIGTFSSTFRHALQFSREMLERVNDCALSANLSSNDDLDVVLQGQKIGKRTHFGQTTVYAFKNFFVKSSDISPLINSIENDIDTVGHEFILTGYGEGANFAAKVAARLSSRKPNQIKVIVFCANSKITDNLSNISMLSRLHFCRWTEWSCCGSSMIEFNMTPSISQRFSFPKCATSAALLVSANLLVKNVGKGKKLSEKTKTINKLVNFAGLVGAVAFSFSKQQEEYFLIDEIWGRYYLAGYRLSFAPPEEYKDLGLL